MENLASYLMCKESLIFSNSIHLGLRTGLSEIFLKGDHQRMNLAKLGSNWLSSFRGKKIKKSSPLSLFLATVAMLVGSLDCRTQFWKGIIQGLFKQSLVPIRFFRIISILSKFCYFRPTDHVISMELLALNFQCQCTQQKLQSICAVLTFDTQL